MNPTNGQPKANKTDAGNGSKAICRVSNVLRSPSPDPSRSRTRTACPYPIDFQSLLPDGMLLELQRQLSQRPLGTRSLGRLPDEPPPQ
jgi:hypothetical protein